MISDMESLNELFKSEVLPTVVVYGLIAIIGLAANILLIVIYCLHIEDKRGSRYFIPILGAFDALGCVVIFCIVLLDSLRQFSYPGTVLCKTLPFFLVFAGAFSMHLMLVIALQRYLMICRPFGQQLTQKLRRISLLIIFIFALIQAIPITHLRQMVQMNIPFQGKNISVEKCFFAKGSKSFSQVFGIFGMSLILVNISITIGLYCPIIVRVRKMVINKAKRAGTIAMAESNSAAVTSKETVNVETVTSQAFEDEESTAITDKYSTLEKQKENLKPNGKRRKTSKHNPSLSWMFLVMIIVYIISILPLFITRIMQSNGHNPRFPGTTHNVFYFFRNFPLLSHASNCFIFMYFDRKFRNQCFICLRAVIPRCMKSK